MFQVGWNESLKRKSEHNGAEAKSVFTSQKGSLYWTAAMITGDAESAEHAIVDATGLVTAKSSTFRDWLVEWAHVATARAAVNIVRTLIREAAFEYGEPPCSRRKHVPLSPAEVQSLLEVNTSFVTEHLDVLARTVLVLYGCHRFSFSDCTLLLNVPLQSITGAYCRARQWFDNSAAPAQRIRHSGSKHLHALRHDPDGVPVWGW